MPNLTEERRVRKTKRAIRNAFAALLAEKDVNEITVKDIAEHADINRKTFYNHYRGVYQVMDEIENSIVEDFDRMLIEAREQIDLRDPGQIYEKLTQLLQTDIEFYGNLLCANGNNSLKEKLFSVLKEHTLKSMQQRLSVPQRELEIGIHFTLSGLISVFQHWFQSDRTLSLDELNKVVSRLSFYGVSDLLSSVQPYPTETNSPASLAFLNEKVYDCMR